MNQDPGSQGHLKGPSKAEDELESSTNPHPSGYFDARVAALTCRKDESSTNPHSEEHPMARLAALEEIKSLSPTSPQAPGDVQDPTAAESSQALDDLKPIGSPISLLDLSLGAMSLDVRAVLSAPHVLIQPSRDDEAIVPLPSGAGEFLCVTQSSKEAWFSLAWEDVQCDFCYDPSGDSLVLKNRGSAYISAVPVLSDNKIDEDGRQVLDHNASCVISPGPWRVSSLKEEAAKVWTDILLFRRRYVVEKSASSAGEAGLKRKSSPWLAGAPKRVLGKEGEGDRSVVLLANPSREKRSIVTVGQPLCDLRPGETVTIRSLTEDGLERESRGKPLDPVRHSSENYSLTHLRDIVVGKGLSSVFRASHPVFGHTAVKVIRSLKDSTVASIPWIGQMWRNEVELMRKLDHPSIIKMFGSDARLYSIYMEYLPYTDLAIWRNRPINHFFSGTPDDARRVLGDMASALVYLEEQGIIHNDIKPSNILYDRVKGAILIDFGLASTAADILCLAGSPWYIAPEFRYRKARGLERDMFALGVTLLYLLKKMQLPDATEAGWIIAKVHTDESEGQLMKAWNDKVDVVAQRLAGKGIESVVKQMLKSDHPTRISARGVMEHLDRERLETAGSDPEQNRILGPLEMDTLPVADEVARASKAAPR